MRSQERIERDEGRGPWSEGRGTVFFFSYRTLWRTVLISWVISFNLNSHKHSYSVLFFLFFCINTIIHRIYSNRCTEILLYFLTSGSQFPLCKHLGMWAGFHSWFQHTLVHYPLIKSTYCPFKWSALIEERGDLPRRHCSISEAVKKEIIINFTFKSLSWFNFLLLSMLVS